jgi:hypothetical protein
MKKVLTPTVHGILDYALALAFLLAPGLLGFSQTAATVSYITGAAYVGASLVTDYPLGLIRLIPFPVHGVLESIMAVGWLVFPWAFGFAGEDMAARNLFIAAGIGLAVVAALTNYKPEHSQAGLSMLERRTARTDRRRRLTPVAYERRRGLPDRRVHEA